METANVDRAGMAGMALEREIVLPPSRPVAQGTFYTLRVSALCCARFAPPANLAVRSVQNHVSVAAIVAILGLTKVPRFRHDLPPSRPMNTGTNFEAFYGYIFHIWIRKSMRTPSSKTTWFLDIYVNYTNNTLFG